MLITVRLRVEVKRAKRPGEVGAVSRLGGVGRWRLLGEVADGEALRGRLLEAGRRCFVGPRGGCVLGSNGIGTGGVHEMRNRRKSCQKRVASSGDRVSWLSNRVWSWVRRGRGRTGKTLWLNASRVPKMGRMSSDGISTLLSTTSVRTAWSKRRELEGRPFRRGKMMLRMGREANVASSSGMT